MPCSDLCRHQAHRYIYTGKTVIPVKFGGEGWGWGGEGMQSGWDPNTLYVCMNGEYFF